MDVTNLNQIPKWGMAISEMEEILDEKGIAYTIEDIAGYKGIEFTRTVEGNRIESTYIFCYDMQIEENIEFFDTDRLVMAQHYIYDADRTEQLNYYNEIIDNVGQPVDGNYLVSDVTKQASYAYWDLDEASINAGQVDLEEGKEIMYICYNVSPVGREAFKQYVTDVTLY
jgi:hypothetical protein